MTSTWGEPDYANTDAMQGPTQLTAVADFAMARGIRHFSSQATIESASGMQADYFATASTIPGGLFRYDGALWQLTTIPTFASAAARDAAITTPRVGWLVYIGQRLTRYSGSAWKPAQSGLVPMVPSGVGGSGVTVDADGLVTFASSTSIQLINCFTDDYDDYRAIIHVTGVTSTGFTNIRARLSLNTVDVTTSTYDSQYSYMQSTLTAAIENASSSVRLLTSGAGGHTLGEAGVEIAKPKIAAATRFSSVGAKDDASHGIVSVLVNAKHRNATAYDGLTIFPDANAISGTIKILGYSKP